MKIPFVQSIAIVGAVFLLLIFFVNFTEQGKAAYAWLAANTMMFFLVFFICLAAFFLVKNQAKEAWAEPWEVLKAACEHPQGGFRRFGLRYRELCGVDEPILITRIEAHMGYVFSGNCFFPSKKHYSFMLEGTKPPRGTMLQAWRYELSAREMKELQKSGVSLEDAYTKIREIRQLDNAVKEDMGGE